MALMSSKVPLNAANGGEGADRITTGKGDDVINGGEGNDTIVMGATLTGH